MGDSEVIAAWISICCISICIAFTLCFLIHRNISRDMLYIERGYVNVPTYRLLTSNSSGGRISLERNNIRIPTNSLEMVLDKNFTLKSKIIEYDRKRMKKLWQMEQQ